MKKPKLGDAAKPDVTTSHALRVSPADLNKISRFLAKKRARELEYTRSLSVPSEGTQFEVRADPVSKHEPARKRTRIKVGGVYVTGDKASPAQLKIAIAHSSEMLERLARKITRPGLQLRTKRDIPLFSADPDRPGYFLRKLNGKIERGVLENGSFKVID